MHMFRGLCVVLLSFAAGYSFGQNTISISGKVMGVSGPLPGATVFIPGTMHNVITDKNGYYLLDGLPNRPLLLAVNYIGYETAAIPIVPKNSVVSYTQDFVLKESSANLKDVIIKLGYPDEWWKIFCRIVIGDSDNFFAKECILTNKKDIRFKLNDTSKTLTVTAIKPLIFKNNALGYEVVFDLEKFSYRSERDFINKGYIHFKELTGSDSLMNEWKRNRALVYHNSLQRFLRELYKSKKAFLDNYHVVRTWKTANEDKAIAQWKFSRKHPHFRSEEDSIYYLKELAQSDSTIQIGPSLERKKYTTTKGTRLFFSTPLSIGIVLAKPIILDSAAVFYLPNRGKYSEYYTLEEYMASSGKTLASLAYLNINDTPVEIFEDGNVYPQEALKINGYWYEYQKLSLMLPSDYQSTEPDISTKKKKDILPVHAKETINIPASPKDSVVSFSEKLYPHTDKNEYVTAGTLWFKKLLKPTKYTMWLEDMDLNGNVGAETNTVEIK